MKRRFIIVSLLLLCLLPLHMKVTATETVKNKIEITYKNLDRIIKDRNGTLLLTVEGNSPKVNIVGNEPAATRVNTFYKGKKREFEAQQKKDAIIAKKDYADRTEDENKYWMGYGLGSSYTTGRVDTSVISFIENNYEYTGGAHPNSWRYGQTFDANTGKRLTLEDITKNKKEAIGEINAFLLKETKKEAYKDYFFPNYEESIKDILTEDSWYFSDTGLVIICNEYIISPHVVGILEFTIPYDELHFIKPIYLPQ